MGIYTLIDLGRPATETELQMRIAKITSLIESGAFVGIPSLAGETPHYYKREFHTLEVANEWLDFVNTFTPAPISGKVVQD